MTKKLLNTAEKKALLATLANRFKNCMGRHAEVTWKDVNNALESNPEKLAVLQQMEITGGEPDCVGFDRQLGGYLFFDCSTESPAERRSFCYDRAALNARKENKPSNNVIDACLAMGAGLLNENQYHYLQTLGKFDLKTSSWILTPDSIRKAGGALFCDRRYDHVFTYHNGAESYYASRGFRTFLCV